MSNLVTAKLIVGLLGSELTPEHIDMARYGDLDIACPYYEPDFDVWVIGVDVHESSGHFEGVLDSGLEHQIAEAHKIFTERTGLIGRLYLSPHVY